MPWAGCTHQVRAPEPSRRNLSLRATLGLWTLLFVGTLAIYQVAANTNHGDTPTLIEGARTLHGCLTDPGTWGSCDFGIFAPLQYIPAVLMVDLGLGNDQIFDGLAGMNTLAFVASILLVWRLFRSRPRLAALGVLALLASPLIWYSGTSYAEGIAPLIFLWLIYAGATNANPGWIGLAAGLAVLSKDTAVPFVIIIGLIAILALGSPEGRGRRRRALAGLFSGAAVGLIVLALSNLMRWGSVVNESYTDPLYRMPAGQVPSAFGGLWLSPNGGLLVFWPLAVTLIGGAAIVAIVRLIRAPRAVQTWWAPALVACTAIGSQLLLASWWAPFGWAAWGPRLSLPVIGAFAVLGIAVCAEPFSRALDFLKANWAIALTAGLVIIVMALPHLGAVIRPFVRDLPPDPAYCPPSATIWTDPAGYFRCLSHATWHQRPIGLTAVQALWSSWAAGVCGALYVTCLSALVVRCVRGPRSPGTTVAVSMFNRRPRPDDPTPD